MSKKLLVGLIVAFVVAAALPMVAQAQYCKYIGPADPLALNSAVFTVGTPPTEFVKTMKSQKEIFYCYTDAKSVPDDKTLQDPLANRDKITKGLVKIVEMEIFAIIIENLTSPFVPGPAPNQANWPELLGDGVGDDDGICEIDPWTLIPEICVAKHKTFKVTRIEKELRTAPPGSALDTWVVTNVQTWGGDNAANPVPAIPIAAARRCISFGKSPYTGGPIPVEDPQEQNMVVGTIPDPAPPPGFTGPYIKTIKVNKEVFRCFNSGSPDAPVIYDIELYTEEFEDYGTLIPPPVPPTPPRPTNQGMAFEVAYCAKKEKEAFLLGCSFKYIGVTPFFSAEGTIPAALKPFTTLTSAGVRSSAGKYVFEAQGYNIEGVQVQVYNLSGKQVFSAETGGTQLSWNGLSSDGRPLPNGVYLYVMTVKGTYGDIVQTKVQKLAILR